ncbi:uncharacterized protein LOC143781053 [Ranitomeya variabilis]|uniref:uncharacterized protein LOC143781052 n=1 Tax=Ranitomeya variabilis TaxID=490064 RepID=UPI0040563BA3
MTSRELRQLNADNETWLSRPENQGQAIILHHRLREQRRLITNDGHHTDRTAVTERGRRARASLRQRADQSRERSRSPLRPAPAEPSRPREVPAPNPSALQPHQPNHLFNRIIRLQGMGVYPPPPHMRPPSPPAQYNLLRILQQRQALCTKSFPTRRITSEEEAESCTICIMDYEVGEEVVVLPCNHCYHPSCISTWLRSNPRCPLCRSHCFL